MVKKVEVQRRVYDEAFRREAVRILLTSGRTIEQEEERASREVLQESKDICEQAGIQYSARTERGGIAETIDRVAREERVDQIIMGTRGLSGVRGLLLGSVATQVLHLVDVPVTFVK